MICPKCGFEQPDSPECIRCGVLVDRYRGPALGADALRPPVSPRLPSPMTVGDPPPPPPPTPALAAVTGTVYGGPPPQATALAPGAFRGTFGVGEIRGETFSIYFANFLPFVLLTALALTPTYILTYFITTNRTPAVSPLVIILSVLLIIL